MTDNLYSMTQIGVFSFCLGKAQIPQKITDGTEMSTPSTTTSAHHRERTVVAWPPVASGHTTAPHPPSLPSPPPQYKVPETMRASACTLCLLKFPWLVAVEIIPLVCKNTCFWEKCPRLMMPVIMIHQCIALQLIEHIFLVIIMLNDDFDEIWQPHLTRHQPL